ncbi:MAG: YSC84-related protein, partial [Methyloceanibacter sp.]
ALIAISAAPPRSEAASAAEINCAAEATLQITGVRELGNKAAGILLFPSVVTAGLGFGGEYGEGLLLIHGRPAGYYNLISASFGFQIGVQERSVVIMFMTNEALAKFKRRAGWKVGIDGSVTILNVDIGGPIYTDRITSPVIGFILDPKGLMYNLTLEGSKISRISR